MKNQVISIPPKIAMINDLTGFGRCSTTVALPVMSACKVQVCPVPTSIFSNHPGFQTFTYTDYTDEMENYLTGWEKLSLSFDGIYCGYLGSIRQMDIVTDFIQNTSAKQVLIDPVMGDHGKAYRTITPEFCDSMKHFIHSASIITPNLTEACLLTNTPYPSKCLVEGELCAIIERLHELGPNKIVITGILNEAKTTLTNFVFDGLSHYSVTQNIEGESRPGTGDIFASILAADSVNGISLVDSVKRAAAFVSICTKNSSLAGVPLQEGVIFENYLDLLWAK